VEKSVGICVFRIGDGAEERGLKILIADDQARRYSRLVSELGDWGVDKEHVEIVSCANDARDAMSTQRYDLFILDILLPLRPEQEPAAQNALDLLLELQEGDSLRRPAHIVGITADRRAADEASAKFGEWTWTIVHYSELNDDWLNQIRNCVRYVESEKNQPESRKYGVDLAIVCALERPELEEVLKLKWEWGAARPIDDVTFVYDGKIRVGGRTLSVAAASCPRMGMVAAALRSASIIALLRPKLLAMCGICAGVEQKTRIGDVLFADPSWDYQSGKRVRDKDNAVFSMAPHQLAAPSIVRTHLQQIASDNAALAAVSSGYGSDAPGLTRVIMGPVASGSAVLADGQVVSEIKAQHRELIGIEMETYGVYAAAYGASQPQPRPFSLKGVCDFADPDKEDDHQRYAAYASANVLRLLMERFGTSLLS
jgi:nucleoside phosphorylase